jgi:carbonic anhydrase/acetyltransferase-like protein (isoleucine patch superfamily)
MGGRPPPARITLCAMLAWKSLLFIIVCRWRRQSRISMLAHLKAVGAIRCGSRTKVHAYATLDASGGGGIVLGDGATINRYAMIQGSRGGVLIGNGSEINNYSILNGTGGIEIGENVLIGPHVQIISYQHEFSDVTTPIKRQPMVAKKIPIGDDVWIGAGAIVMAGIEIGDGSVIGAGSVVTRSCPPYSVLAGVPARIMRSRVPSRTVV